MKFERNIAVELSTHRYVVKTAETREELERALRLRHVAFIEPLGICRLNRLDEDEFDVDSDHLIVIDRDTQEVCGNYRLRASCFTDRFYSEGEFDLTELKTKLDDGFIELGRACVHPDHRSGIVVHLLFRGLIEYAKRAKARYFFGCSSVALDSEVPIETITRSFFDMGRVSGEIRCEPFIPFEEKLKNPLLPGDLDSLSLPPLLDSYLKIGAKLLGPPALDAEFKCVDYLTLTDLARIPAPYARRYEISFPDSNSNARVSREAKIREAADGAA